MQKVDYASLDLIANEIGDTFYILDRNRFRNNYKELLGSFREEYENTHIAYSYKTNYLPCLCRIVEDEGGYAEVVSDMELYAARRLGVGHLRIYHNGPYKKEKAIRELVLNGGHVNLDSEPEVQIIKRIARENKDKSIEVGIRCSLDIGQEVASRFGFDTANGDLERAVQMLEEEPNVIVTGCHTHLPYRSLESFEKRIKAIKDILSKGYFKHLKYISTGGGMMGSVDKTIAGSLSFTPPSYSDYACVVAGGLRNILEDLGSIELIIEPGSAIVADAMSLVARVVSIKNVKDRTIATLSGSTYNMNPKVKGVNRPIEVYGNGERAEEYSNVDFAGYTCIEDDIMYSGYNGRLSCKDFVIFHNVGSYSIVMKPPFILPDIPIIEIEENGKYSLTRVGQKAENVFER